MIVNLVFIWVKEKNLDTFVEASIENHKNTIKEPGNLRFDILRDSEDPSRFVFYEAFKDEKAVAEHKATAHYMKWRDTVADWMVQPRKGVKHTAIAPSDERQWMTGSI
ncbi:MAG TPA: antibiotic biosynthesis monooxygenase [Bacteroidales bacterium]|jgi:autoinducer 2-degrading protein|nr:antibiotic biosynthesis monooxygenase [Bacteroidales bacterium]